MSEDREKTVICEVCKQPKTSGEVFPLAIVHEPIFRMIQRDHPQVSRDGWICSSDLNIFRVEFVKLTLEEEKGELTALEEEVVRSIQEQETVSKNINAEYEGRLTVGERLSDRLATYGGSWRFILGFFGILFLWLVLNAGLLLHKPFDPFPFILLNLVLSCLAAIQAPIIMMSQNRQDTKDRLRSEFDYRVNLKAELEVRFLHQKLDHFLRKEWQTMLEIQEIQIDLMKELSGRKELPEAEKK
ncbi:MAG: DUF1003 domain-containing protein [Candidatus Aminicenantales bacterium]